MSDKLPVTPVKKNKSGEVRIFFLTVIVVYVKQYKIIFSDFIQVIRSKQKRLIINMYKTKKENEPNILYKQLIKELMNESGLGKNSIERIISEYNSKKTISSPNMKKRRPKIIELVDDFDKNAIRQKIHMFWRNSDPPTLDKIMNAVSEDDSLPTLKRTTMHVLLKDL